MTGANFVIPPVYESCLPGVVWPAVPGREALDLLAMRRQLEQSQWWPLDYLERQQFDQLESVLDHVLQSVPYYRERLASAGFAPGDALTREAWGALPLLTRRDIQSAGDALRSDNYPGSHGPTVKTSTSGSTGTPLSVVKTGIEKIISRSTNLREVLWHRRDLSAKFATIRRDRFNTKYDPAGFRSESWGQSVSRLYHTGPQVLLDIFFEPAFQIEWLIREAPDYLLTLPSNLKALALHAREHRIAMPPLRQIRTYGEALADDTRQIAREIWQAKVVDVYSAEEFGIMAIQCPDHDHYHVQSEAVFLEVIDANGRPCAPGETGQIVVSTLHNFAMPLIRYAIGDFAEVGGPCPCGRTLPVLTRILGRTRNMLVLPSGVRRFAILPSKVVSKIPAIIQQQVVQTGRSAIEIRMVARRPLDAAEEAMLRADFGAQLVEPFDISIAYVDEIPRSREGKYEDFVCQVT